MFLIDNNYKASKAEKKIAKQEEKTFTEGQERGIQSVMRANGISREKAISALKKAGRL